MENDSPSNRSTPQNGQTDSGVKKRSIITQQDVKRTLLSSGDFTRQM